MARLFYLVRAHRDFPDGEWKRAHRKVKTKREATGEMAAWRAAREKDGWTVDRVAPDTFVAYKGDRRRSFALHEYDPETHDRLYQGGRFNFREVFATGEVQITEARKKPREKDVEPKPRRGRGKPAYA